jgi:hypothetical protein
MWGKSIGRPFSMRALTTTALVAFVLLTFGAPAAQPLSPLVAGWERYFTVQAWSGNGAGRPSATVWNTSEWGARRIQVLFEAVDAGGQPVAQRVVWLGAELPAGTHADVAASLPAAASYRARVFAFELESSSGPR